MNTIALQHMSEDVTVSEVAEGAKSKGLNFNTLLSMIALAALGFLAKQSIDNNLTLVRLTTAFEAQQKVNADANNHQDNQILQIKTDLAAINLRIQSLQLEIVKLTTYKPQ